MEVIKYLNKKAVGNGYESALEALTEDFGIKVTYNEEYHLYVLNYSQIDSPKTHPIVVECRSLVIKVVFADTRWIPEFKVVSRSFDRFLNLGEDGNEGNIDITKMKAYEKLDGSLIGLFYHNEEWLYRTKSVIEPNLSINGCTRNWKDLVKPLIGIEQNSKYLDIDNTYIFEVVSRENRVVTRYSEDNLYLLAIRRNKDGKYL